MYVLGRQKRQCMGETTLKTFALHYQILWVVVANLVHANHEMFTLYHAIMFGILLITGSASIFQMSEGEKGLTKSQTKISKPKFDLNSY